jgi:hypothetical protein
LAFLLCVSAGAERTFAGEGIAAGAPRQPKYEFWAGAEAFAHDWSVYSGVTASPFSGIEEDGLRLRAMLGYGAYTYAPGTLKFHGNVGFGDLLLGYHQQLGPVTLKLFGGLSVAGRQSDDPFSSIDGTGWGGKAVAEVWWDINDRAWTSLDLSWASLHDSYDRIYSSRLRLGWRVLPALSAGLEAGAAGNDDCDIGRLGAFVRYEWAGGEVSLSGGLSNENVGAGGLFHEGSQGPFVTASWLMRF